MSLRVASTEYDLGAVGGSTTKNQETAVGDVGQMVLEVDVSALAERIATLVLRVLKERQPSSSPWLDIEGATAYLGCSVERLRKLVQRRAIPFHQERPNKRIFLHRLELDE